MNITISMVTPDQVPAVTAIYQEVLTPYYISFSEIAEGKATRPGKLTPAAVRIFQEQLQRHLDSPQHGFFVACLENGTMAGFAIASLHKTEGGHIEAWLDDIGVVPVYARQGIGERLINHVETWVQEKGAKCLLLESGYHNKAHDLFIRLGFTPLAVVFYKDWVEEAKLHAD